MQHRGIAMSLRWVVAVLCVVLGGVGGFAYTRLVTPTYETTATVIATETTPAGSRRDVNVALALSRLTNQQESIAAAATELSLTPEEVSKAVRGSVTPESPVIAITADAPTGAQAAEIANAVADALVTFGTEKMTATGVRLSVLNVATAPVEPASPNLLLDLAIGVGGGVLVGALYLLATGGARAPAAPPPQTPLPGAYGPGTGRPPTGQAFPPPSGRPYPPPPGPGPNNRPPQGGPPRAPVPPPRRGGPGPR